jgi:hypothetical protein
MFSDLPRRRNGSLPRPTSLPALRVDETFRRSTGQAPRSRELRSLPAALIKGWGEMGCSAGRARSTTDIWRLSLSLAPWPRFLGMALATGRFSGGWKLRGDNHGGLLRIASTCVIS